MLRIRTILLPAMLPQGPGEAGGVVAVFDVLRATTTITAAMDAGVRTVRVYGALDDARRAAAAHDAAGGPGRSLLMGEAHCVRPDGFALGNSPRDLDLTRHADAAAFMSTTNGTKALLAAAARPGATVVAAAITNAAAVARRCAEVGGDVILLCAGTDGQAAAEDMLGAGAVAAHLADYAADDLTQIAMRALDAVRGDLAGAMRLSAGGRNLIRAGLEADIDFAARINASRSVATLAGNVLCR